VLLVVASNEGIIKRHLRNLPRAALRSAVRGGVLAAMDALIAPRPKWKVRGVVGIALGLRRCARVACRPRCAGLLCRVLVSLLTCGRLHHDRLIIGQFGRGGRRTDRVRVKFVWS
jgi:hypothetical protein